MVMVVVEVIALCDGGSFGLGSVVWAPEISPRGGFPGPQSLSLRGLISGTGFGGLDYAPKPKTTPVTQRNYFNHYYYHCV